MEHLASLDLPIGGRSVLEVGAGIGDHSQFFIDRGCDVTITESREENLRMIRARFPNHRVLKVDVSSDESPFPGSFDVVYCYGVLYHLPDPARSIEFLSRCCGDVLLLETCVSPEDNFELNPCAEDAANPSQSITGIGCRPTRNWIFRELKRHFSFVYLPVTQPRHEEFPVDWNIKFDSRRLTRSVFVASRRPISNPLLSESIPRMQARYDPGTL